MTKLSDISPVNLAMHQFEQRAAEDELRYLMQRRDAQNDKIRFGLIALNGGSLLALIGALGGNGTAASWLGFTPQNALISSASFGLGLILSGIAVVCQQNLFVTEAGDASARVQVLRRLVALYDQQATPENHDRLGEAMKEFHDLSLTGFQFSYSSIVSQNFSAGAWVMGILVPLSSALQHPFLQFWNKLVS